MLTVVLYSGGFGAVLAETGGLDVIVNRWWGFLRSLVVYHNPRMLGAWREFYRHVLSPGDIVFDVGAHVGTRARAMRSAGAQVIALEPQAPFARFLRFALPADIVVHEVAVGSVDAEAEMAVSSRHPTLSSLRTDFVTDAAKAPGFEHVRWDNTARVRVVTLDRLIRDHGHPSYIKIDVEGFELEVLSGLSSPVKLVSVEFLPGFPHLTVAVLERLAELGDYLFNPVVGEKAVFLWPEWRDGDSVREWLLSQSPDATSGDLFARLATTRD